MTVLDAHVTFTSSEIDESPSSIEEAPEEYVSRLSHHKARAVAKEYPNAIVLGGDTAVVVDGQVLGKPSNDTEARSMLRTLRSRTHRVVTGVTVVDTNSSRAITAVKSTNVLMRDYSDLEIEERNEIEFIINEDGKLSMFGYPDAEILAWAAKI